MTNIRKRLIGIGQVFLLAVIVYIIVYAVDSASGGYRMKYAMDGHDCYSSGLAEKDAILWQPLYGYYALGDFDYLGLAFDPLIRLDRQLVHRSHYLTDTNFDSWCAGLTRSQVHPLSRDGFFTRVDSAASRDTNGGALKLTFRLTGSTHAQQITELRILRTWADAMGASPPRGFVLDPHYEDASTNGAYRWLGRFPLPHDQDVVLLVPATKPAEGSGRIEYRFRFIDNSDEGHFTHFISLPPAL